MRGILCRALCLFSFDAIMNNVDLYMKYHISMIIQSEVVGHIISCLNLKRPSLHEV
jgi:hypothetical protein